MRTTRGLDWAVAAGCAICMATGARGAGAASTSPAASGVAVEQHRVEVRAPSASEAKAALRSGAAKAADAVEHAASAVRRGIERAEAANAHGARTTTTITTGGASAPLVIRQERR